MIRNGHLARLKGWLIPADRSLALALLGGLIGLGMAGIGLFHWPEKPLTQVPAGYVAVVNGQPILMSDFITETETATGGGFTEATPAQRRGVLHKMIDAELLVQRGLALNLPETDTDVRTAMGDGVNAQASAPILAQPPADEDLRAWFRAHLAKYQSQGSMRYHDIVLHYGSYQNADQTLDQAMSDAAEAVYQLRSGAALGDVIAHFGFNETENGKDGDEFDFAARIHLGDKLFAAASALKDGEISNPVSGKDGVHVIVMEQRRAPVFTGFDSVRNNVYGDYAADRQARVQQQNLQLLRRHAAILLAPGQSE